MVSQVPPKLAETLKRIRASHHLTQERLSARCKGAISVSHIGMVESGSRSLSVKAIDTIAMSVPLTGDEHRRLLAAAGHEQATPAVAIADRLDRVERLYDDLGRRVDDMTQALEQIQRALEQG